MVVREGFEPSKAKPTDLQSAPFDRSGTSPRNLLFSKIILSNYCITFFLKFQLEYLELQF